jgi:hypothetical protein
MFPAHKESPVGQRILDIMGELDALIKIADEHFAPESVEKDGENVAHGEYLGRLHVALENARYCLKAE